MKYLENAIKFCIKNWMLILPLFVLTALANLLGGVGKSAVNINVTQLWSTVGSLSDIRGPGDVFSLIPAVFSSAAAGSGIWAFLFQFASIPITYGLINKALETGNASLNDIGMVLSGNFIKYVMYSIGTVVVGLVIGVGALVIFIVLSLLAIILKGLGVALLIIFAIALLIALIIFGLLISMWLSAMVVDGLDVVAAGKKSIEVVKNNFINVLLVTAVVSIASTIAGAILGIFTKIPLLGPIIYSAAPVAQTFIMAVILLSIYREQTGKINTP